MLIGSVFLLCLKLLTEAYVTETGICDDAIFLRFWFPTDSVNLCLTQVFFMGMVGLGWVPKCDTTRLRNRRQHTRPNDNVDFAMLVKSPAVFNAFWCSDITHQQHHSMLSLQVSPSPLYNRICSFHCSILLNFSQFLLKFTFKKSILKQKDATCVRTAK